MKKTIVAMLISTVLAGPAFGEISDDNESMTVDDSEQAIDSSSGEVDSGDVDKADRYTIVCVRNRTNITVNYRRSVNGGDWGDFSLSPGGTALYTQPIGRPAVQVSFRFDSSLRSGQTSYLNRNVTGYRSPSNDCSSQFATPANVYFNYDNGDRNFIELYSGV